MGMDSNKPFSPVRKLKALMSPSQKSISAWKLCRITKVSFDCSCCIEGHLCSGDLALVLLRDRTLKFQALGLRQQRPVESSDLVTFLCPSNVAG